MLTLCTLGRVARGPVSFGTGVLISKVPASWKLAPWWTLHEVHEVTKVHEVHTFAGGDGL